MGDQEQDRHERHERYEALAVGHVLGGLSSVDATEFRSHLVGCRECRTHVAELRDLADSLADAEREERQLAATKTEVAVEEDDEGTRPPVWRHPAVRMAVALLGVTIAFSVLFWTYHLRRVTDSLDALVDARGDVIRTLTRGVPVAGATLGPGVTGLVATEGSQTAFSISGIPAIPPGSAVVVWLLDADGVLIDAPRVIPGGAHEEGWFSMATDAGSARSLVVSVEALPLLRGMPQGERLLDAPLPGNVRPVDPDALSRADGEVFRDLPVGTPASDPDPVAEPSEAAVPDGAGSQAEPVPGPGVGDPAAPAVQDGRSGAVLPRT